jgi:hypothetical protein
MYYRIFILFPNSKYLFTKSRKAVSEKIEQPLVAVKSVQKEKPKNETQSVPISQKEVLKLKDSGTATINKAPVEEEYLILPKIDNSRIYYLLESSNFKKPSVVNPGKAKGPTIEVQKILVVKKRDSVIMMLAGNQVSRFSDSLVRQTKDTLLFVNADTLQIKPYIEIYKEPKEVYKISPHVFTAKDGNVTISLPDYNHKNYFVTFFETDSTSILEVRDIKYQVLTIDKTNFGHSGWFRFELYEDGKLKEKNKLFIPRD